MPVYISLLRAINLPGHNRMKMSELEAAFPSLGLEEVETYRQSGNLTFRAAKPRAELSETSEAPIQSAFGFSVAVISRTANRAIGDCARRPRHHPQLENGQPALADGRRNRP